jgi:pimeloyl-ACP methyl ester carboxylesterase
MATIPMTGPRNNSSTGIRRIAARLRSARFVVLLTIAFLPLIGIVYQAAATAVDQVRFPPPGRLLAVGEGGAAARRMHIYCLGEGSPTIVLDHAGGVPSPAWSLVQPQLAEHTRVCAYDRAGYGWSEPASAPNDLHRMVADLDELLTAAGEHAPYVLVGHSYGARVARLFAATYSSQVAGLVLLDPAIDYTDPRYGAQLHEERAQEQSLVAIAGALAPFGLVRLLQPIIDSGPLGDLPPAAQATIRSFEASNQFFRTVRADEQTVSAADNNPDVAPDLRVQDLGDLPLLVISAGQPDDAVRRIWTTANAELAQLSTRGRHQQIPGATHMGLVFDTGSAKQVAAAILSIAR